MTMKDIVDMKNGMKVSDAKEILHDDVAKKLNVKRRTMTVTSAISSVRGKSMMSNQMIAKEVEQAGHE